MSRLAIKGHATRGSEVIEILGILGGSNAFGHIGNNPQAIYYIDENYEYFITCSEAKKVCDYIIFTLEEFLEKYPYKVGDKVTLYKIPCTIKGMSWDCDDVIYYVQGVDFSTGVYSKDKDLQPYKEETMETITIDDFKANTKEWLIDKLHGMIISEAIKTIGNIHDELHKPKYPKTYKECCDVLGLNTMDNDAQGHKADLIIRFQELLIACDAYWKIAGEQMGLGKSWEPDWTNNCQMKWTIYFYQGKVNLTKGPNVHFVLAFPTEEMRDAFYENFKDSIEQCKELL